MIRNELAKVTRGFAGALIIAAGLSMQAAENSQQEDVILKALGDELKRSLSLRLEDLDKPYFVQYAVDDSETYRISASFGSIVRSSPSRSRVLHSQVRVGSYDLDNSNFAGRGGRRGASVELPVEDGYMALRQAIWRATDWQYKDAVEVLTQKRAYLKDRIVEDRPKDFTKADASTVIKERVVLKFDRPRWEEYVRQISAVFATFPHLQDSSVGLVSNVENRYLLNSEGTRTRHGTADTALRITAEAQAADGERLSDALEYYARTAEQLPKLSDVLEDVKKLSERLASAVKAPILEDYTGPVLMDGVAAAQIIRQLLSRGIAGQTDPLGAPRRGGGTDDLDNRLGKRILPTTFQIYDDPRVDRFQNVFLAGHYLLDDEGIAAQRVSIVADGKLEGMVMSRTPTKHFTKSNGHGRRSGGETPRSTVGCVFVESTKTESAADLKKELIDAADSEGLKFGLRITSLQNRSGGGFAGRFGRGGAGAARSVGDPIRIYKVYVADGREELVRGCEFQVVDMRSLRRIIAVGDTPYVHNSTGGGAPASTVIAPAMVFEELELAKIKRESEKKPLIAAPHARLK